ncbi:AMP-binding enzyme [Paraburkholderia rhizosphaerae]|uniref:AMP-binding enzyme n=2 Tax=Paraburkholderia rhizosphaerae TaxID=480658 RepID=A0A4R8LVS2_9BURK|nr:AMP-binding enzyme [Paraburkholderia rhizosphaerae]
MSQSIRNIQPARSTSDPGVVSALFAHARACPQAPASARGEQCLSFAEVAAQVCRLVNGLRAFGLKPGDRVLLQDPKIDGWFRTGDMLWMDDIGELHYVSRRKLLLIRDGENISPVEVEAALRRHPAIEDAAVAGVPDAQLGQRVIAFVVPGDTVRFSAEAVLRDLSSELSDFKMPEMLVIVERIPRTPLRKLDRRAIDQLALEQSLPAR